MKAAERAILERFKALVSERVALYKLVLFGSRARGDADPDSDLDVRILTMYRLAQTQTTLADARFLLAGQRSTQSIVNRACQM